MEAPSRIRADRVATEIRADFAGLGLLAKPRQGSGGAVFYQGRVGRTGPLQYPWGIERRDNSELAKVVRQLPGIPIVVRHPDGLISEGAEATKVGRVVRAWIEGDFATAELRIDSPRAHAAIAGGLKELSLGYTVDVVEGFQRHTVLDHLAIVDVARCGEACAIRADSCQACKWDANTGRHLTQDSRNGTNLASAAVQLAAHLIANRK